MSGSRLLIFTDLDGTLLDRSYRAEAAAAALAALRRQGVPLIFCSSKSRSEQQALRAELGVSGPFITENGSAIYIEAHDPALAALLERGDLPAGLPSPQRRNGLWLMALGLPAETIRERLLELRARTGLPFRGYAELDIAELAALTGLSPDAAQRARQREFSETLVGERGPLEPAVVAALQRELPVVGLQLASGGRFVTVTGLGSDKGRAVKVLTDLYARAWQERPLTVGIGDSENDRPLLAAVDRAFVVQKPDGSYEEVAGAARAPGVGPVGWNRLVLELLAAGDPQPSAER